MVYTGVMKRYFLKNKKPVLEPDILKFEEFLNSKDKIVKQNNMKNNSILYCNRCGYNQKMWI